MTVEASEVEQRRTRKSRGGNTLVQKMAEDLEAPLEVPAPEEVAAAEARRQLAPDAPGAEEPEPYNPFLRPEALPPKPSPRVMREERQADRTSAQPTPSAKRLGSLGKKLPGAERAKVHKRLDSGQLAYVGEYTEGDLSQSQDMESFLAKYIKPIYGAGEYQVTGVDAHGRQFDMGIVTLLSPLLPTALTPEAQLDSPLGLVKTLIDRTLQQQQGLPEKDPIEMLGKLHDLKRKMDPPPPAVQKVESRDNTLILAIVSGLTTVASTLVSVFAQPKAPDPLMAALAKKLLDDEPRRGGGDLLPPPLPPPDPTEQLKNLAAVVQSLRGDSKSGGEDNRLVDYLLKDRMTPTEVLNLVNQVKGERGTDDFKKSMENIGIMLNAVNQLRAHTEPGAGAGFWDAIGALVNNKELGNVVAETIRGRRPTPGPQQPQPEVRVLPQGSDPIVTRARQLAVKRLEIEEQELMLREKRLQEGGAPKQQPQPQPQPQPQLHVVGGTDTEKTEAAVPQLPANIADFINRYVSAEDDAELVAITLELLYSLGNDDGSWKEHSVSIFNFIAQSDKARFLHYMASFWIGLRSIKLIEEPLAQKIMHALSQNFSTIVKTVQQQMAEDAEGGEDGEDGSDGEGEGEGDEDLLQLGKEEPLS